jgi:ribonuclease PH
MTRPDGRAANEMRPVRITPNFLEFAEGSALIELGRTRVICAASIEDYVPGWRRGRGEGWLTAEYSLLPRSTHTRTPREVNQGRVGGRTQEIQRLIGRSLRMAIDLEKLGERTVTLDCDVIQADGGTRTAAITGAYVALALACRRLFGGSPKRSPLVTQVAATSAGLVLGEPRLDLDYQEDSQAQVDFNVVMDGNGRFIEVQGTAEGVPYTRDQMAELLDLAQAGIADLFRLQRQAIG